MTLDWEKVSILDFEKNYRKRNISEMIHIKEQKNSLNLMKDTELLVNSYFNISMIYGNINDLKQFWTDLFLHSILLTLIYTSHQLIFKRATFSIFNVLNRIFNWEFSYYIILYCINYLKLLFDSIPLIHTNNILS